MRVQRVCKTATIPRYFELAGASLAVVNTYGSGWSSDPSSERGESIAREPGVDVVWLVDVHVPLSLYSGLQ